MFFIQNQHKVCHFVRACNSSLVLSDTSRLCQWRSLSMTKKLIRKSSSAKWETTFPGSHVSWKNKTNILTKIKYVVQLLWLLVWSVGFQLGSPQHCKVGCYLPHHRIRKTINATKPHHPLIKKKIVNTFFFYRLVCNFFTRKCNQ